MNSKGDPAVMSKPGEMKCKLTLQWAFPNNRLSTKGVEDE